MGTPFAVSAAVIYMAKARRSIIVSSFYRRFIDDIFFIWNVSLFYLHSFLDQLNNLAPTIKLTVSQQEAIFLNTVVYIDRNSSTRLSSLIKRLSIAIYTFLLTHIIQVMQKEALLRPN